ncbi:hypothetical protein ACH4ZX_07915 [Streptomyces sp. NPDC020490]|uniref:hypothetical protein n=1 Tax=Streptomyces sp. NPDC020490 TaxID=3365078 RepID=UPI003787B5EA
MGCSHSADVDPPKGAPNKTKAPGSFAEPFPEKLSGTLNLVSVTPAEGASRIPEGAHHKIVGDQLTVLYRGAKGWKLSATGAQAEVSDLRAAMAMLTEKAGKPAGARTDWVPVNPGSSPALASCQNLAEGEGTRCYWVDADTVGYMAMSEEAATLPFDDTRLALEGLEAKKN